MVWYNLYWTLTAFVFQVIESCSKLLVRLTILAECPFWCAGRPTDDVHLVSGVVEGAVERPVVADGRHHDDVVGGQLPDLHTDDTLYSFMCIQYETPSITFSPYWQGFGSGSARIRMFLPCKKVRKWMNKSLFRRVGDVQFHFFCSDFKHPLLRIIWNVKKTQKKIHFSLYPPPPPPDTPRIRIRIRMKIFTRIRIRIRKKKMRIRNPVIYLLTRWSKVTTYLAKSINLSYVTNTMHLYMMTT